MTHLLRDILRQPEELQNTLRYLQGEGRTTLQAAASVARQAPAVYLTGIGSSWHAAICAYPLFRFCNPPIHLQEGCDFLPVATLSPGNVVIAISRSGRSVEIVNLLAKARERGATVIGITCSADGNLAREAQFPILLPTRRDHAVSVNTYSTLAAAAGVLAAAIAGQFEEPVMSSLTRAIDEAENRLPDWQAQVNDTNWLEPGATTYFLGRGCSLGTAHEARLLWEEAAKSPATAIGTGSFRHGPQEIVMPGMRFGVWIDAQHMREQDFTVVRDLGRMDARVMLIGQDLPANAAGLIFQLPHLPADWQFLVDMLPAQLAAERLARMCSVDPDSFRFCSYIVESEYGLLPEEAAAPKDKA